ncbi:MAG: FAD-dependent oxidoreductase [Pseudomonadota bacterium]
MGSPPQSLRARIAIVGGGIIGLSIASVLGERGYAVTIYDPNGFGRGASWAAAGMLSPAYEAAGDDVHHPGLLRACFLSKELWTPWIARLGDAGGGQLGFLGNGSFALATTEADERRLARMTRQLERAGWPVDFLEKDDLVRWEPGLGGEVRSGLALTSDGRVDNRAVIAALLDHLASGPDVRLISEPAPLTLTGDRISVEGHDVAVIAAGWQSPGLSVLDGQSKRVLQDYIPALGALKAVKGQMLAVDGDPDRPPPPNLRHGSVYVVPRGERVIIGATSEDGIEHRRVDGDTIARLRAAAGRLVPALSEGAVRETWAGIRPGSPDHAPLIGPCNVPGVILACGHFRNGILLSPLTADLVADCLEPGPEPELAAAFSPDRFSPAPV